MKKENICQAKYNEFRNIRPVSKILKSNSYKCRAAQIFVA